MISNEEVRAFIRSRISPQEIGAKPDHASLRNGQWCKAFERLMRNRLIMGALRYETFQEKKNKDHGYDLIGSAISRLQKYKETGNMEHLVDVANLCMIEFDAPSHSSPTWESIDDGEHVKRSVRIKFCGGRLNGIEVCTDQLRDTFEVQIDSHPPEIYKILKHSKGLAYYGKATKEDKFYTGGYQGPR